MKEFRLPSMRKAAKTNLRNARRAVAWTISTFKEKDLGLNQKAGYSEAVGCKPSELSTINRPQNGHRKAQCKSEFTPTRALCEVARR